MRSQIVMLNADGDELKSQFATSSEDSSRSQFATLNEDGDNSRSQNATLKVKQGQNIKYLPYAFTENGIAMLSCVNLLASHPNLSKNATFGEKDPHFLAYFKKKQ